MRFAWMDKITDLGSWNSLDRSSITYIPKYNIITGPSREARVGPGQPITGGRGVYPLVSLAPRVRHTESLVFNKPFTWNKKTWYAIQLERGICQLNVLLAVFLPHRRRSYLPASIHPSSVSAAAAAEEEVSNSGTTTDDDDPRISLIPSASVSMRR